MLRCSSNKCSSSDITSERHDHTTRIMFLPKMKEKLTKSLSVIILGSVCIVTVLHASWGKPKKSFPQSKNYKWGKVSKSCISHAVQHVLL